MIPARYIVGITVGGILAYIYHRSEGIAGTTRIGKAIFLLISGLFLVPVLIGIGLKFLWGGLTSPYSDSITY